MEFCPKCGAILISKDKTTQCPRCDYSSKEKLKLKSKESINEKDRSQKINVVDGDIKMLPITNEPCKKCGHPKTYFWTVQTRAGDEAETKFFKCVKCEHTWREYR